MIPPTKKQLRFINSIEQYVDERFTGTTIKEASEYISRNIENYKKVKAKYNHINISPKRDEIIEETFSPQPFESGHRLCPICGGRPRIQDIKVYKGRADHKWSCTRKYYKNIICLDCGMQTGRTLCKEEYDDSDTIYPKDYYISNVNIWEQWDNKGE